MSGISPDSLWASLQSDNPWWPSYQLRQTDVLSWRHATATLLREIDPEPICGAIPDLFQAIYDQTADIICDRLSWTEGRLTWAAWFDVWLEHFDSWNDPVRQLVDQHCIGADATQLAQMLTRLDGASFCDFVLDAYERMLLTTPARSNSEAVPALPLHQPFTDGWPFERLAYGYYRRFCRELDQEPEPAPRPLSELDFNRAGHPNVYSEDAS